MAKKSAKKTARKSAKSAVVAKRRNPPRKVVAKEGAGVSHVSFGLHGIAKIVTAVHEAGLGSELHAALGHDHSFVQVPKKSLGKIKDFVASKPQLAPLHAEMTRCDCPPDDPYCIYI